MCPPDGSATRDAAGEVGRADPVERGIRGLLAEALRLDPSGVVRLPRGTRLFGPPLDLGSLSGAKLLLAIRDRYGVDVAAEDLALDSLETIDSLCEFVRSRVTPVQP